MGQQGVEIMTLSLAQSLIFALLTTTIIQFAFTAQVRIILRSMPRVSPKDVDKHFHGRSASDLVYAVALGLVLTPVVERASTGDAFYATLYVFVAVVQLVLVMAREGRSFRALSRELQRSRARRGGGDTEE